MRPGTAQSSKPKILHDEPNVPIYVAVHVGARLQ